MCIYNFINICEIISDHFKELNGIISLEYHVFCVQYIQNMKLCVCVYRISFAQISCFYIQFRRQKFRSTILNVYIQNVQYVQNVFQTPQNRKRCKEIIYDEHNDRFSLCRRKTKNSHSRKGIFTVSYFRCTNIITVIKIKEFSKYG